MEVVQKRAKFALRVLQIWGAIGLLGGSLKVSGLTGVYFSIAVAIGVVWIYFRVTEDPQEVEITDDSGDPPLIH